MRWAAAIAFGAIILLAAGIARAENPEALRLFVEGRALAEQGKYAEACALFAKSHELESAAGTILNLADCAEREGQLHRAWLMYEAAAAAYDKTKKPSRAMFARSRANVLVSKLATVILRLAEPRREGLTLRVGDRAARPAVELVELFDPGEIPIIVSAPGREPFSTTVTAPAGERVVVDVPALRPARAAAAVPGSARDTGAPRRRSRVLFAAGVAGAGVLALGASGLLAWSADRLHDEQFTTSRCVDRPAPEPDECLPDGLAAIERAGTRADLATVAGIGGGVLLAAGAVLYLTAPRERVTVSPLASSRALGLAFAARF